MNAQVDTSPEPTTPAACPLCAGPVPGDAVRCGACGYHLAGVAGRPSPFTRPVFLWTAAALVLVYVVTLAVVYAAR